MLKKQKLNSSMKTSKTFITSTKKRCPFHYRGLERKGRKSEKSGVTGKSGLGVQNEAGQRLTEFRQENALVVANTLFQQTLETTLHTDITRQLILKSDCLYSLQSKREKLYTVSKIRPGADCGSDHQFLTGKFRLHLKKVGNTTRPFRYDLNQIPYDYTMEATNRFKGLDLTESA